MTWRDRIAIDPTVCGGMACIRGTRIQVDVILGNLAAKVSLVELLAGYPSLSREDIRAAIEYAAELARQEIEVTIHEFTRLLRKIDFSNFVLRNVDFHELNFEGAHFSDCDLTGADFRRADLYWADFFRAILTGANLESADLRGADLKLANLQNCNLQNANLGFDNLGAPTRLDGADLRGATLTGAAIESAVFDGALFDCETRFPIGFDAVKLRMKSAGERS